MSFESVVSCSEEGCFDNQAFYDTVEESADKLWLHCNELAGKVRNYGNRPESIDLAPPPPPLPSAGCCLSVFLTVAGRAYWRERAKGWRETMALYKSFNTLWKRRNETQSRHLETCHKEQRRRLCTVFFTIWYVVAGRFQIKLTVSFREDWILRGSRSSSFWVPRNLSHHMIRQAQAATRTGDTVLVKSRDMTGRAQTLSCWLRGEGVKTTENKIDWLCWYRSAEY